MILVLEIIRTSKSYSVNTDLCKIAYCDRGYVTKVNFSKQTVANNVFHEIKSVGKG